MNRWLRALIGGVVATTVMSAGMVFVQTDIINGSRFLDNWLWSWLFTAALLLTVVIFIAVIDWVAKGFKK